MSTFDRPTSTVMGSRAGFLDIILQIVRSMLRFLSNYKIMALSPEVIGESHNVTLMCTVIYFPLQFLVSMDNFSLIPCNLINWFTVFKVTGIYPNLSSFQIEDYSTSWLISPLHILGSFQLLFSSRVTRSVNQNQKRYTVTYLNFFFIKQWFNSYLTACCHISRKELECSQIQRDIWCVLT